MQFVLNNGTKWAKLSREMKNRTEHCVKNRFFGILAKYCLIPIKKIKKTLDYLNHGFLFEAIKYYQTLYEVDDREENDNEDEDEKFLEKILYDPKQSLSQITGNESYREKKTSLNERSD